MLLALLIGACAPQPGSPAIEIRNAWSRPTAEGMPVGVAYFEIVNRGQSPDTLIGAGSPACGRVEFHHTQLEGGMARMRPAGDIVIAPGETVKAGPDGLHLMLMDLKQPLLAGTEIAHTLRFAHAGDITVRVRVDPRE